MSFSSNSHSKIQIPSSLISLICPPPYYPCRCRQGRSSTVRDQSHPRSRRFPCKESMTRWGRSRFPGSERTQTPVAKPYPLRFRFRLHLLAEKIRSYQLDQRNPVLFHSLKFFLAVIAFDDVLDPLLFIVPCSAQSVSIAVKNPQYSSNPSF